MQLTGVGICSLSNGATQEVDMDQDSEESVRRLIAVAVKITELMGLAGSGNHHRSRPRRTSATSRLSVRLTLYSWRRSLLMEYCAQSTDCAQSLGFTAWSQR